MTDKLGELFEVEARQMKLSQKNGMDGWTILQGDECLKLRHDATKRIFTLVKVDELYWNVFAASPLIDGTKKGAMILKIQGLRNALLAIGFLKNKS